VGLRIHIGRSEEHNHYYAPARARWSRADKLTLVTLIVAVAIPVFFGVQAHRDAQPAPAPTAGTCVQAQVLVLQAVDGRAGGRRWRPPVKGGIALPRRPVSRGTSNAR
jgi:hypothetical protein